MSKVLTTAGTYQPSFIGARLTTGQALLHGYEVGLRQIDRLAALLADGFQ